MAQRKASVVEGTNEQKVIAVLDPVLPHFVFKSKYREDNVTLRKPVRRELADGTAYMEPAVVAQFNRSTWATDDAELAKLLRDIIKRRLATAPLHILETTDKE